MFRVGPSQVASGLWLQQGWREGFSTGNPTRSSRGVLGAHREPSEQSGGCLATPGWHRGDPQAACPTWADSTKREPQEDECFRKERTCGLGGRCARQTESRRQLPLGIRKEPHVVGGLGGCGPRSGGWQHFVSQSVSFPSSGLS